jgi:hypothetical protein
MGFIYLINNISPEDLSTSGLRWNGFPSTIGTGDRTLMDFLNALDDKFKQNLLDYYTGSTPSDFALILNNVSSSSLAPIFSRETASEFHKLTIAAFNGFASTFIRLKEENDKMVGINY